MKGPQYSVPGYCNAILMSSRSMLLVEGVSDKRAFQALLSHRMPGGRWPETLTIDTAEMISGDGYSLTSNRAKVELVCRNVSRKRNARRFVGFVDREFRKFGRHHTLIDSLTAVRVSGRLVWSRGHSLENYYFDEAVLANALRRSSPSTHYVSAIPRLLAILSDVLHLACAIGLVGRDLSCLSVLRGCIDWMYFQLNGDGIALDVEAWKQRLSNVGGVERDLVDRIVAALTVWREGGLPHDRELNRWACDGHIGLAVVWAVYARCVHEASGEDAKEVSRVLHGNDAQRATECAESWAERAAAGQAAYPDAVLRLLGMVE